MNLVILKARLCKDPEVRYSQGTPPMAIAKYSIAVNRDFKKDGEQQADFFNVVAFGKAGEFAEKYFKKGMQVLITGRLQTGSYDKDGVKHYTTDIIAEKQEFCESKKDDQQQAPNKSGLPTGFVPIEPEMDDDSIPF